MTAQHPAAPETETDANGLDQLDKVLLYLWSTTGSRRGANGRQSQLDYGKRQARMAVERIVAERVRVVEGERDAARAQIRDREANGAEKRAESAEAAHEAEKAAHGRRVKRAEALLDAWEHDAPGLVDPVFAGRLREVLRRDPTPVRLREDDTLGGGEAR